MAKGLKKKQYVKEEYFLSKKSYRFENVFSKR